MVWSCVAVAGSVMCCYVCEVRTSGLAWSSNVSLCRVVLGEVR